MTDYSRVSLGFNILENRPYNVMVVDDSVIDRTLVKRILIRKEFRVIAESQDGEQALQYIEKLMIKPDILCIDQEISSNAW